MKKINLQITLITNDKKDEYRLVGKYDEEHQVIEYIDKGNDIIKTRLDLKNKQLVRDSNTYHLSYEFDLTKETVNKVTVKELNQIINIKIKTIKFSVILNTVEIIYKILDSDETVKYILKY